MNKIKKLISATMSAFLFSVVVISNTASITAFAYTSIPTLEISNGAVAKEGIIKDDFSDATPVTDYKKKYVDATGRDSLKIFTSDKQEVADKRIIEEQGNKILQMKSAGGATSLAVSLGELGDNQKGYFSYNFRIDTWQKDSSQTNAGYPYLPLIYGSNTGGAIIHTNMDGKPYFNAGKRAEPKFDGTEKEVELNKWYKVLCEIGGTGTANLELRTHVYDAVTGECIWSGKQAAASSGVGNTVQIAIEYRNKANEIELSVDNVELYVSSTDAPLVTDVNIEPNEDKVKRNAPIIAYFTKAVTGELQLYKEVSNEVFDVVVTTCKPVGVNGLKLEYDGLLEKGTKYKLSFGNIEDGDGNSCETEPIFFTTETMHKWKEVEVGAVSTTGSGDSLTTTIEFEVATTHGYGIFDGAIMAAWYRKENGIKKMMGMGFVKDTFTAGETESISFNLGGTPLPGDILQIMQFDSDGALVPLSAGQIEIN